MKHTVITTLILFFGHSLSLFSQNLLDERIRQISPKKRSIFLERGIFHNGGPKVESSLKAIRHNFNERQGHERVVFDFSGDKIPRIYGYISMDEKKLYLDLFNTSLEQGISAFGSGKYIDSVNFFPIQKDSISMEIVFKKKVSLDIFYLESPGRFVFDIKK